MPYFPACAFAQTHLNFPQNLKEIHPNRHFRASERPREFCTSQQFQELSNLEVSTTFLLWLNSFDPVSKISWEITR